LSGELSIELRGFEEALCDWLSGQFRFAGEDLKSIPLATGRNFFANFMPEAEVIVQAAAGAAFPFDARKEPAISFYTSGSPGIRTSASRWVKLDTTLNLHLRVAGSFERAKSLLEEVYQFVLARIKGKRVGAFQVKAANPQQRPSPYQRQGDDRSFAQASIRFLYVALNA